MLQIEGKRPIAEYLELLNTSTNIYMDQFRLSRAVQTVEMACLDLNRSASLQLAIESGGKYSFLDRDMIIRFMLEIGLDLDKRFGNRKTKSYSLDLKKVVEPMIEAGILVDFLTEYRLWKKYKTYLSALRSYEQSYVDRITTPKGRQLNVYNTTIVERENLRTYYKDIAVVSVPKLFSDMITGPTDDHFIAWCDYPQADWRFAYNLFIRDEHNEQIMRNCDDAYEALARLVEGDSFDKSVFAAHRKEYKVNCLSTFYNSKASGDIPAALRKFYLSCPKYDQLLKDLALLHQFKLPIPCTSYFGHEQLISESLYRDAFVSKGLNTPIQTFTSHVVIDTVFGVLEKFWELGYTKDEANVYYVRHDEPLFLFRSSVLKDAWVFEECSKIHIPGFTPISLDFHFGYYYQEEDEGLTKTVRDNIANSNHTYTTYDGGSIQPYNPLPSVNDICVGLFPRENGDTIVVIQDRDDNIYSTVVDSGASMPYVECVQEALASSLLDKLGWPQYLKCQSIADEFLTIIDGDDDRSTFVKGVATPGETALMREEAARYG